MIGYDEGGLLRCFYRRICDADGGLRFRIWNHTNGDVDSSRCAHTGDVERARFSACIAWTAGPAKSAFFPPRGGAGSDSRIGWGYERALRC